MKKGFMLYGQQKSLRRVIKKIIEEKVMKTKLTIEKIIIILTVAFCLIAIGMVLYLLLRQSNKYGEFSELKYYDGNTKIIDVYADNGRMVIVCENGEAYISGKSEETKSLLFDCSYGTGLNFNMMQVPKVDIPKKAFDNVSSYSFGFNSGTVIDKDGVLYYFDSFDYRFPTEIYRNVIKAKPVHRTKIYILKNDNTLISLDFDGNETVIATDVKDFSLDSRLIYLTNDNELYEHHALNNTDVKLFDGVESFDIGINYGIVVQADGKMYVRGDIPVGKSFDEEEWSLYDENVAEAVYAECGIAVRYMDSSLKYIGEESIKNKDNLVEIYLRDDGVKRVIADYGFVIALTNDGKINIWGKSTSNAFPLSNTENGDFPFSSAPYVLG